MIKAYATIASVGFLLISGAAGCSSASTPDDGDGGTGNTAGSGVLPSSGTGSTNAGAPSGTGGSGTAGSPSGTAGTPAGTAGTPAGTAGTGSTGLECKGIKTGAACMPEGTDCQALKCGLADSGTRSCQCASTWTCSPCDFSASPFKDKPADITTCTTEADKGDCTGMQGKVCEGAPGGEVCACWPDDEGTLIWDCDKPPSSWAAPAM